MLGLFVLNRTLFPIFQDQEKINAQQKSMREAEQERQWKQLQAQRAREQQQQNQQQQHNIIMPDQRMMGKFYFIKKVKYSKFRFYPLFSSKVVDEIENG